MSGTVQGVILVVDDEPLIRMFACDLLGDQGFETIEADNGSEALAILDQHPEVSVLLTDVNMPGAPDGIGLAHDARERRPGLRIVITSGRLTPHGSELPAGSHFIAKPYSSLELLSAVGESNE